MKALSVWQPWASLIAMGAKWFETRPWALPRAYLNEDLIIQASMKKLARYDLEDVMPLVNEVLEEQGRPALVFKELPFGEALCIVRPLGCFRSDDYGWAAASDLSIPQIRHEEALGNFARGRFAWGRLADLRRFVEPWPLRGQQGLFHVPDDIVAQHALEAT